jgi:enoyl-CoA hydratase
MPATYERIGTSRILTINRPEARNAVDGETARALRAHFQEFAADDDARVLIVTGAGGEAFCAGADLKKLDLPAGDAEGPMGFTRLHSPKPTIAAVEGWCAAGGFEIACWCDVRIAAEHARFGVLNRRWGVPLIDGGTVRLPKIVGLGRALELIMTGRDIDAQEALAIGLANRVVPRGQALTAALEMAERIAAAPWPSVLSDRRSAYEALDLPIGEALARENEIGRDVLRVGAEGAARFAAGEGRHGARTGGTDAGRDH